MDDLQSEDRVHDHILSAVLEIAGITEPSEHTAAQLELPVSRGGLGLTRMGVPAACAGRLSAAILTQAAFEAGPTAFQPFQGESASRYALHLERLRALQPGMWPENMQIGPEGLSKIDVSAAWKEHQRALHQSQLDQLLSDLGATSRGPKEVARLRSCSAPEAGAWIDALPITPHLRMRDLELRTALKHMVGHCTLPADAPAFSCECGAQVSHRTHDHAMVCKKISGDRTLRHDTIVLAVRRSVTRAGLASSLEPKVHAIGGGAALQENERVKARGNILVVTDDGRIVLDVSVTHASADSYAERAAVSQGHAAQLREQEKVTQYQRQGDRGFVFRPFVMETHGRLGKQAWDVVNSLAKFAADRGKVSKRAFKRGMLQEVSVALCCGNSAVYAFGHACQAKAQSLGRRFRRGLRRPTADLHLY